MELAQRRPARPKKEVPVVEYVDYKSEYSGKVTRMTKESYDAFKECLRVHKRLSEDIKTYTDAILSDRTEFSYELRPFKSTHEGFGLEYYPHRNYLTFEVLMITYKSKEHRVFVSEFYPDELLENVLTDIVNGTRKEPEPTNKMPYKGISGTTSTEEPERRRPKRAESTKPDQGVIDDIRAGFGGRKRQRNT